MVINIATTGRFHLLDLARELAAHGHTVRLYSYVPTKRVLSFGLPRRCCFSFFLPMLPVLALMKIFHRAEWTIMAENWYIDHLYALFMKKCDVLISLSGVFVATPRAAKRRFGTKVIIERGSKHVLSGTAIFLQNPNLHGKYPYAPWRERQELECYELGDYISIAADHVLQSFLEHGFAPEKFFINPYGVDLKMFPPTELAPAPYDVLFVGTWCWTKGCDILAQACAEEHCTLLHAGSRTDLPFPQNADFRSLGVVEQKELAEKAYRRGKIFVIASRQEGLAMVQAQALACGLPLVCTPDSGGRDLRTLIDDPKWVIETKDHSVAELRRCMHEAWKLAETQQGVRKIFSPEVAAEKLSWQAYGDRYHQFLVEKLGEKA